MRRASRSAVAQALQSSGMIAPPAAQLQCLVAVDAQAFNRERRMKCFPFVAVSLYVASLAACSYKEERVVQPAPAPAAVTAVPAGSVVYTQPAPTTTTVYPTR